MRLDNLINQFSGLEITVTNDILKKTSLGGWLSLLAIGAQDLLLLIPP
jgi:hypothetical protein